ncbi:MAG: hypothetical protein WA474_16110 [Candidatus Sulfotelmatobacter sp.]
MNRNTLAHLAGNLLRSWEIDYRDVHDSLRRHCFTCTTCQHLSGRMKEITRFVSVDVECNCMLVWTEI